MTNDIDREVVKEVIKNHIGKDIVKEAIKEWMNEQFSIFGRWTFTTFAVIAFGWVIYGLISLGFLHRIP